MLEFFGHLERLASDLYPWRWVIMAIVLLVVAAVLHYAYKRGWHTYAWERRVRFGIIGAPVLALLLFIAWDLGSPLFINKTVEEEFPFAFSAQPPEGCDHGGGGDGNGGYGEGGHARNGGHA